MNEAFLREIFDFSKPTHGSASKSGRPIDRTALHQCTCCNFPSSLRRLAPDWHFLHRAGNAQVVLLISVIWLHCSHPHG